MVKVRTATPGTASAMEFKVWGGVQNSGYFLYPNRGGGTDFVAAPVKVNQIELVGNIAPGWKLIQPLSVSVEIDEEGQYLLVDEMFSIFGEGASLASAQRDLVISLIEYYTLISEYEDAPSQQLLGMLRKYLRPTPAFYG
ncbi:MAG: hypothetical protein IT328_24005 [Caldilineaceae bacterium]|nr:hypothetical protein [Caldilineaceae bacterium]